MPQKSILIAEDEEILLEMLQEAMAVFGCDVHAAKDGASALELMRQVQPTLMILDLDLPEVSGEMIIREIQASPKLREMALIITTASPASYLRQFERFATLVVQKPYQLAIITDTVDRVLNGDH